MKIRRIIIHDGSAEDGSRAEKLNEFHVDIIRRRLNESNLTTQQKLAVIDQIIESLKLREINGIIR